MVLVLKFALILLGDYVLSAGVTQCSKERLLKELYSHKEVCIYNEQSLSLQSIFFYKFSTERTMPGLVVS